MTANKTTYVGHFTQESYRRGDEMTRTVEADSIEELVKYGADNAMTYCDVQERETVTMNGKSFNSDPAPLPGRLYFDVRDIVSRDTMIADSEKAEDDLPPQIKDLLRQAERMNPGMKQLFEKAAADDMAELKALSEDARFAVTGANKRFRLTKDDRAYDAQGQQVWPAPQQDAPAPVAPKAKTDDTKADALSRVRQRNRFKL